MFRQIIDKAASKTLPIIFDDCKRLGIRTPEIRWVRDLTVGGKSTSGTYNLKTQEILLNFSYFDRYFKGGISEPLLTWVIVNAYFHEFKHYIDHKFHKVSLEEFKRELARYEADAIKYSIEHTERLVKL